LLLLRHILNSICHSIQVHPIASCLADSGIDQIPNPNQNEEGNILPSIAGSLEIVVTDTGVGISKDNQKRLFKEIIQFSPEKLQAGGGSGLGLLITSGILYICIYMYICIHI
jgi:signal transduction histidine kinase